MSQLATEEKSGKPRVHYAYAIAIACCFIMFGGPGMIWATSGVFYAVLPDAFGVPRATIALYSTILSFTIVATLPVMGKMLERFDARIVLTFCCLSIAGGFFIFSMAQSVYWFYAGAVVIAFGGGTCLYLLCPTMIGRWFRKKNGFFLGLCASMTGLSGIVFSPVLGAVVEAEGWRIGYLVQVAIILVLTLPFTIFVIRSRPEDKGLLPYGYEEAVTAENVHLHEKGVTLHRARRASAFYLCCVVAGVVSLYTCINYYITSYAVSLGYALTLAAVVGSAAMWGQFFGKICLGAINDKSTKLGLVVSYGSGIVGLVLMMFFGTMHIAVLFVAGFLFGIGYASMIVQTPLLVRKCFGNRDYSIIYSNVAAVGSFCAAIGATLFGWIIDISDGSYDPTFWGGIVFMVIALIAAFAALKAAKSLIWMSDEEEEQHKAEQAKA